MGSGWGVFLNLSTLFFETQPLTESAAHLFRWTFWPPSFRNLPVSSHMVPGSQAYTHHHSWLLNGCWGSELRSPSLHSERFTKQSIFSSTSGNFYAYFLTHPSRRSQLAPHPPTLPIPHHFLCLAFLFMVICLLGKASSKLHHAFIVSFS